MKLMLFSTQRKIRDWLNNFSNTTLDKHQTIGDFFSEIIVVKGKKFIDKDIRKIYLFEAIQNIDISSLGFSKEFLSFSKDSDFIFSFLKELFLERVNLDDVIIADTYIEYEEHLNLIKQIKDNYKKILDENGYIDLFLIDQYEINKKLLDDIDKIEIFLDGYLSKFEREILDKIDKKIILHLNVSKFNKNLISKISPLEVGYSYILDYSSKEILSKNKIISNPQIEVSYFSKRFDEINFVFAKIAEFVDDGIDPDNIVVILPDESFSEFLEEFDNYKNLNFAMGKNFTHSTLYIKLKSIYDYLVNEDEVSFIKSQDWLEDFNQQELLEFIKNKATNKELQVIDDELFKLKAFKNLFKDKKQFLHFILERFKEFSFDDVYSGKVTVMGVLESRGMEYDGVILVDFNDGIVPNVNSKDLFLNTAIRKKANLPTRIDKENLQKHYYYSLIHSSKKVAISYVHNESESVSRFLYELDLDIGLNQDKKYEEVLYSFSNKKEIAIYEDEFEVKYPLTPTSLKILLECPKRYYFSKVLNIFNESEDEDNFGSVLHEVLEEIVKNKTTIDSAKTYFETLMSGIFNKLNSKIDIYNIRVKFEDKLKKFCELDFENMRYSGHIVEEFLNVEFEGIRLTSKVDRIDIKTDEIVLIDYKTGKIDDILKHPYDFQLTFYYLWAKKNYPDKKITTVYWDIKNCELKEVTPKVDELKEVLKNLPNKVEVAKDIVVDEKVIKKASDICKWCDYKVACGRG